MRVTTRKLAIRQRQAAALDGRLKGKTYRDVAAELGVTVHTAFRYVEQALDAVIREPAEQVREMELQRLDRLYKAASPAAESGDAMMIAACLKIQERRARLLGLDAPESLPTGNQSIAIVVGVDAEKL